MDKITSKGALIDKINDPELKQEFTSFLKRTRVAKELNSSLKEYRCVPNLGSCYTNGDKARGGFIKITVDKSWSKLDIRIKGWRKWSMNSNGEIIDLEHPIIWEAKGTIEEEESIVFKYQIDLDQSDGKTIDEFHITNENEFEFLDGSFEHCEEEICIKGIVKLIPMNSVNDILNLRAAMISSGNGVEEI